MFIIDQPSAENLDNAMKLQNLRYEIITFYHVNVQNFHNFKSRVYCKFRLIGLYHRQTLQRLASFQTIPR
jgi:hypothetical protein